MTQTGGRTRAVPAVHGVIALALLAAVAFTALVVVPPSPPSVAEFAPAAADVVTDAPDAATSRFGSGGDGAGSCEAESCDGARAAGSPSTTSAPPRPAVVRTRTRRCVGDPPRQTEDPQSPPCRAVAPSDNGGATSKGVSRDEIRVGVPGITSFHQRLVQHFNNRYELHGRRLRLVDIPKPGDSTSAPGQRAVAAAADERGVFAALEIGGTVIDSSVYRSELARRAIVAVFDASTPTSTQVQLDETAPYVWSYHPPMDRILRNLGEFACAGLAGRPADYSGTEIGKRRKFGMLYRRPLTGSMASGVAQIRGALARCDETLEVAELAWDEGDEAGSSQRAAVALADLRARGVTTVVYLGQETTTTSGGNSLRVASGIGYQPEWLIAGTTWLANENFAQRSFPPEQRSHVFGVVPWNKTHVASDEPAFAALREVDPSAPASVTYQPDLIAAYHSLLVLTSGIQLAGPRLTPDTFAAGLRSTGFPNPGAGQAPLFQGTARPASGTFLHDLAVVWWSETAPQLRGNFNSADGFGGYCWLGRGNRFSEGQWPRSVELFAADPAGCR